MGPVFISLHSVAVVLITSLGSSHDTAKYIAKDRVYKERINGKLIPTVHIFFEQLFEERITTARPDQGLYFNYSYYFINISCRSHSKPPRNLSYFAFFLAIYIFLSSILKLETPSSSSPSNDLLCCFKNVSNSKI